MHKINLKYVYIILSDNSGEMLHIIYIYIYLKVINVFFRVD